MDLDELVFHPWTAQGPRAVPTFVGGSGSHLVDADGRRYLDFSSQLVFTNLGHQHPGIVAAIKEQADRLCTLAPGHRLGRPRGGGAPDRRGRPGGPRPRAVHDRRYGGDRARRTHGPAAHRAAQGARRLPLLPRLDRDLDPPHRRPAPLGQRHRHGGRRALLRPLPVPLGVRVEHARGGVRAGARPPRAGDPARGTVDHRRPGPGAGDRQLRGHRATGRLPARASGSCAPATASCSSPTRCWSVSAGPVHGSRSSTTAWPRTCWSSRRASTPATCHWAACSSATAIYETFTQRPYPAGMTYSGHPLACAAAVGAIRAMHDEDTVAAAARLGTDVLGPGLAKLAENHPCVGDVRGIGGLWTHRARA